MIVDNWKDLITEADILSQSDFESQINDTFEAMMIEDDKEIPTSIWISNYVIQIKQSSRMYKDLTFVKMPRNPGVLY